MIYVASPYSHNGLLMEQKRYEQARLYCAAATVRGHVPVFSPIVYYHEMALAHSLPTAADSWRALNKSWMDMATKLHVLCLDGWRSSVGVEGEIDYMFSLGKPVLLVRYDEEDFLATLTRHSATLP